MRREDALLPSAGQGAHAAFHSLHAPHRHWLPQIFLRADAAENVHVRGARTVSLSAAALAAGELADVLRGALALRSSEATERNALSSRSHAVLRLCWEQVGHVAEPRRPCMTLRVARLVCFHGHSVLSILLASLTSTLLFGWGRRPQRRRRQQRRGQRRQGQARLVQRRQRRRQLRV